MLTNRLLVCSSLNRQSQIFDFPVKIKKRERKNGAENKRQKNSALLWVMRKFLKNNFNSENSTYCWLNWKSAVLWNYKHRLFKTQTWYKWPNIVDTFDRAAFFFFSYSYWSVADSRMKAETKHGSELKKRLLAKFLMPTLFLQNFWFFM